jgi:hypothetical protein
MPSPLALVDVRNGPACALRLDQDTRGRDGLAHARRKFVVKTGAGSLKGEMSRTVSSLESGDPLRELCGGGAAVVGAQA